MRIIFMGTPDFAVPSLRAIVAAGHQVVAVYTQPPRQAGRGMALRPSPVQQEAERAGLTVLTPAGLKSAEEQARFAALGADAAVVVAYGIILPQPILDGTRHGAFNLHASLLPRWRGAAPINRAIMAGDRESGVSIMRLDQGLDTGPVCLEARVAIGRDMTAGELHDALAASGAALLVHALSALERGALDCRPQAESGVTYAEKIVPGETRIDWSRPAPEVHDQDPRPVALSRRLVRGRDRRQARADQGAALDLGRGVGRARDGARRSSHHRLRRGRRAPHRSAARRQEDR